MISQLLGRAASVLVRVLFALAAMVFAASLLLAVAVLVLVSLVWSLIRGRKATPLVLWQRYREASAQARWASRMAPRPAEVVDVEARDVTPLATRKIQGHPPH